MSVRYSPAVPAITYIDLLVCQGYRGRNESQQREKRGLLISHNIPANTVLDFVEYLVQRQRGFTIAHYLMLHVNDAPRFFDLRFVPLPRPACGNAVRS